MKKSPLRLRPALYSLYTFIPFLLLLVFTGCKPCDDPTDPECKNYDPCYVQGAVSAEFSMQEKGFGWFESLEITNSVSANNNLILVAEQELESYEWQIGTEPNPRLGRTSTVYFGGTPYEKIAIRLIAKGTPNLACDPLDDGIDTLTKEIQVVKYEELPISGKFKGRHVHLPNEEEFEIEIRLRPEPPRMNLADPPPYASWGYFLMNLPKGTPWFPARFNVTKEHVFTTLAPLGVLPGAQGFILPSSYNGYYSFEPKGRAVLSPGNDSIIIQYTTLDTMLFKSTVLQIEQTIPQLVRTTDTLTFIGIRQ